MIRSRLIWVVLLLCAASAGLAQPHIFWASDPVLPGETVVVIGDSLTGAQVSVGPAGGRLQTVPVLQPGDGSLKFTVPAGLRAGLFQAEIKTPQGAVSQVLNRPVLWWAQVVSPPEAPGKTVLRLFGKNLTLGASATVRIRADRDYALSATGTAFALSAPLPPDLGTASATVTVDVGAAGAAGISAELPVALERPLAWPQTVFTVRDYGAVGDGLTDDTAAIKGAIAAAQQAGGGVVYFPRGRYLLSETLQIPRLVTLRGQARELVNIIWMDVKDPLPAQLKGTNSFAIEDITFYCQNYSRFLVADDRQPGAGNVRLHKVTILADRYRGHITAEEASRRMQPGNGNLGALVSLGGAHVSITNCYLYSSGMACWLTRLQDSVVADNTLSNGRWGWYCLSGSDGLIFDHNTIVGGDLMSTGGGLNTLDGSMYSRHIYYANNSLSTMFCWDREAMTSDAGGQAYYGKIASASGATLTLAADPERPGSWLGGCLYIMDGKGTGQYRVVTACTGRVVTLDQPFEVPPDTTSTVTWCTYQGRCLFIDNTFTDAGVALQFYGNAIEHIMVGNKSIRTAGFHNFGMNYGGIQPSWYLQWLGNEIVEGNVYCGDHDNSRPSGEAHLGVYAFPPSDNWQVPLTLATMVRRNQLDNNAHIMLGCEWNGPDHTDRKGRHIRDVVVENNSVSNADLGIFAFDTCEGLLLRDNHFAHVRRPLDGPGLARAYLPPAERAQGLGLTLQTLAEDVGVQTNLLADPGLKAVLAQMAQLPESAPDTGKLQAQAVRAALMAVAKARPEGVPFKTVAPYLGLAAVMPWKAPLHEDLQNRPTGGPSRLDINLTASGVYPEPLTISATITPPADWEGTPSAPVQVDPSTPATLKIPVVVAPGAWAEHLIPVTYSITLGDQTLKATQTIHVGSGFITRWLALGPFPNKSGQALDRTIWPPDEGLDLAAEYDGANGKMKWITLGGSDIYSGFWPDLGHVLKWDKGGTAYLVACVNAPRALAAEVQLASAGGASVSVNGEVAGSRDQSGYWNVPVQLKAGDNVLLLKLTAPPGNWRELCGLGPVTGGQPLDGVTIVAPADFPSRPVFAAPRHAAAPEVGEVRYAGGVDWKLVWADDFNRPTLGPRWQIASGTWTLNNQLLRASGVAFLSYAEKIPAPVRVEYEARCPDAAGDISAFWLDRPADFSSGLLFGFGANGNTLDKLMLSGEQVAQADGPLVQPGKWHHLIAQVLPNGRAQLIVDGEVSLDQVVTPGPAKYPGLYAWGAPGEFRQLRLFSGH